jgi:hypothetical protein
MSLRKKIFTNLVFLIFAVLLMNRLIYANMSPRLLLIACSGELSYADDNKITLMDSERKWIGDVPRGFLYGDDFFAIDNDKLIFLNIKTKKSGTLADLQTVIDENYKPWQVGYVDSKVIYFSAQRYDKSVPINEQKHHSFIYRFDRASEEIKKVDLHECRSPYFSVHNDSIYFVSVNGEISELAEGKITPLGIRGDFPSVSPDGEKICFASFGFINDHVYLYNFKNKISLISFFGPRGVNPIIRWSKDNGYIAVKKQSDLSAGPLYLINANSQKVIQKYEESHACNWFLVDR